MSCSSMGWLPRAASAAIDASRLARLACPLVQHQLPFIGSLWHCDAACAPMAAAYLACQCCEWPATEGSLDCPAERAQTVRGSSTGSRFGRRGALAALVSAWDGLNCWHQ